MITKRDRDAIKTESETNDRPFNRRNILLGSSTRAAASALAAGAPIRLTQTTAQAQPKAVELQRR
jgi:hypothetical protein